MATRMLGNLVCRLATIADKKTLIPALARSYLHEPTVAYTDTTWLECEEMSDLVLSETLPEGHTFIIEDAKGKIASFTMSGDYGRKLEDDHPILAYIAQHRHFSVVGEFEDHMDAVYAKLQGFTSDNFPLGHTISIRMGGTEPEFRNRGLNTQTFAALIAQCQEEGFRYIMSNSTSLYTRKMSERHRMFSRVSMRYDEWYDKDSIYARQVKDGHDSVHLMVLDLEEYETFHGNQKNK